VDGRPLDSDFARGTAYGVYPTLVFELMLTQATAEQMDVHEGTAREAMRFSAYLRQPFSVSEQEKDAYFDEVLELLCGCHRL
jgi:ATP-binding cassette subfamily G (WHITE) protein 2 (SNQ2)